MIRGEGGGAGGGAVFVFAGVGVVRVVSCGGVGVGVRVLEGAVGAVGSDALIVIGITGGNEITTYTHTHIRTDTRT